MMRIHSDIIDFQEIQESQFNAQVSIEKMSYHGSRKRKKAFEVKLSGSSSYNAQGTDDYGETYKAATWDEWGIFLRTLWTIDPDMIAGQYPDLQTFEAFAGDYFDTVTPATQHKRHKWQFDGKMHVCECGAQQNFSALRGA